MEKKVLLNTFKMKEVSIYTNSGTREIRDLKTYMEYFKSLFYKRIDRYDQF